MMSFFSVSKEPIPFIEQLTQIALTAINAIITTIKMMVLLVIQEMVRADVVLREMARITVSVATMSRVA